MSPSPLTHCSVCLYSWCPPSHHTLRSVLQSLKSAHACLWLSGLSSVPRNSAHSLSRPQLDPPSPTQGQPGPQSQTFISLKYLHSLLGSPCPLIFVWGFSFAYMPRKNLLSAQDLKPTAFCKGKRLVFIEHLPCGPSSLVSSATQSKPARAAGRGCQGPQER